MSVAIDSPCKRICVVDPKGAYCIGCARTVDEIRHWIRFDADKRQAIMDSLDERMKTIDHERKQRARQRRREKRAVAPTPDTQSDPS